MGQPFIYTGTSGLLNPLLTVLMMCLHPVGVGYYEVYMIYLVSYFFIGAIGFFLLAKEIIQEEKCAYLAYTLLIFSSVGMGIFNQINMLLIFVPTVWFFVCLLRFGQTFNRNNFWGMILSLSIMPVSYLPFYFVTLLGLFLVFVVVIYPSVSRQFVAGAWKFVKKKPASILLAVMVLSVSCLPLLLYKIADDKSELVSPSRHCHTDSTDVCLGRTLEGSSKMSYEETTNGSLAQRFDFLSLFSFLDKINYVQDGVLYWPIICYPMLFMAAFIPLHRPFVLLSVIGVLLFLIALADVSCPHYLLYKYVFYFKYFRNLFFFLEFLIPIFILACVCQLKGILEEPLDGPQRKSGLVLVVLGHVLFFIFLLSQTEVLFSSFLTVILSGLLFSLYYYKPDLRKEWFVAALGVIGILQPLEVYTHYGINAREYQCQLPVGHTVARMALQRPEKDIQSECRVFKHLANYVDMWQMMSMRDSSGEVWFVGNISRWTFYLSMKIKLSVYLNYVRNKFIIYDHVGLLNNPDRKDDVKTINASFKKNENTAFIGSVEEPEVNRLNRAMAGQQTTPIVLIDGTDTFKIGKYNVNELQMTTNFPTAKFLVYNDSYHYRWHLFINGQEQKIYRTNMAFKGIFLPAGLNQLRLIYQPPGGQAICYFFLIFYLGLGAAAVRIISRNDRNLYDSK